MVKLPNGKIKNGQINSNKHFYLRYNPITNRQNCRKTRSRCINGRYKRAKFCNELFLVRMNVMNKDDDRALCCVLCVMNI